MHRTSMRKIRCIHVKGLVASALMATAPWGCKNDSIGEEVAPAGATTGDPGDTDGSGTGADDDDSSGGVEPTGGDETDGEAEAACTKITPGASPVRRMTRV